MNDDDDSSERKKSSKSVSDAEEIKEIFSALNESIPKLISGVIGSVYSPESAGDMATAIGRFYTKLKEEGIPEEVALDMTKKYVGALDFEKMMSMITDESSRGRKSKRSDDDEEYD